MTWQRSAEIREAALSALDNRTLTAKELGVALNRSAETATQLMWAMKEDGLVRREHRHGRSLWSATGKPLGDAFCSTGAEYSSHQNRFSDAALLAAMGPGISVPAAKGNVRVHRLDMGTYPGSAR